MGADGRIANDTWVTVRYRLFDSQGEPLEEGEREWTYLQGGYGAGLVAEVGQAQNHAPVPAPVLREKVGIDLAFGHRLDGPVPRARFRQHEDLVAPRR